MDDDFKQWLIDFLQPIADTFESILNTLKPAISDILDYIFGIFFIVFDWLFGFISGDFLKRLSNSGLKFFDNVSLSLASSISDGQFIYFTIGALISFPLLKIVINIIRG